MLRISVALLTGGYEAGDVDDRRMPEWPPHPARLFCALVAACRSDTERAALAWLEQQRPPEIWVAAEVTTSTSSSYVVTNRLVADGGNLTHPARTNQLRARGRVFPAKAEVSFVWIDGATEHDPRPSQVGAVLDGICARVPYIGRATGVAAVSATALDDRPQLDSGPRGDGWLVFESCDVESAELVLRVPYAGYLAQLDDRFTAGLPAWEVSRSVGYRVRDRTPPAADRALEPSVYSDFVVLRLVGLRPAGRLAPRFTEALRSAVLRAAGRDSPSVLHGHDADGRPHVAFLALPDVGASTSQDARDRRPVGHLLGMAVALPVMPEDERRAVLSAVLSQRRATTDGLGVVPLSVPGIGEVELAYAPDLVRPWGATPRRWRSGSSRWITATPVVLDRYPKRRETEVEVVRRSVLALGLPEPRYVRVSTRPLMDGGVALRPGDLPRHVRGRLFRHVELEFDRRVAGPMLLGAGRYLGVGLFAPVNARGRGEDMGVVDVRETDTAVVSSGGWS